VTAPRGASRDLNPPFVSPILVRADVLSLSLSLSLLEYFPKWRAKRAKRSVTSVRRKGCWLGKVSRRGFPEGEFANREDLARAVT
jgi:hypothetical protein